MRYQADLKICCCFFVVFLLLLLLLLFFRKGGHNDLVLWKVTWSACTDTV